MKIERCCDCDQPTGNAGAGDGSLFQGAYGPLCDKCFDEWPDKMTAEVSRLNGIIRNQRVPTSATMSMIAAAESVEDLYKRGSPETWGKVWRAMLAAVPRPSTN